MSSKENAAINQLFEKLECRYAARAVGPAGWSSPDFPPAARQRGRHHPNTLNTRIKELRECGLLEHGSDGYTVTLAGQDLLKRLSDVQAFANRWAARAKK